VQRHRSLAKLAIQSERVRFEVDRSWSARQIADEADEFSKKYYREHIGASTAAILRALGSKAERTTAPGAVPSGLGEKSFKGAGI